MITLPLGECFGGEEARRDREHRIDPYAFTRWWWKEEYAFSFVRLSSLSTTFLPVQLETVATAPKASPTTLEHFQISFKSAVAFVLVPNDRSSLNECVFPYFAPRFIAALFLLVAISKAQLNYNIVLCFVNEPQKHSCLQ